MVSILEEKSNVQKFIDKVGTLQIGENVKGMMISRVILKQNENLELIDKLLKNTNSQEGLEIIKIIATIPTMFIDHEEFGKCVKNTSGYTAHIKYIKETDRELNIIHDENIPVCKEISLSNDVVIHNGNIYEVDCHGYIVKKQPIIKTTNEWYLEIIEQLK